VILVVIVDSMGSMVVKVFAVGCLFDGSDDFSLWWFYMVVVMVVPLSMDGSDGGRCAGFAVCGLMGE